MKVNNVLLWVKTSCGQVRTYVSEKQTVSIFMVQHKAEVYVPMKCGNQLPDHTVS
jgi:hypothetical protein